MPDPFMICLEGYTFSWIDVPLKFFFRIVAHAWNKHVCKQVTTRKNFDLPAFDFASTAAVYNTYTYEDKPYIESIVIGKHYTNDILAKFMPNTTNKCPLCSQPDSREHRIFHCEYLDKFRTHRAALKRVHEWPEANWYYGLCPEYEDVAEIIRRFADMPQPFVQPESDNKMHFIFTDGTSFFNDIEVFTMAASAIIELPLDECQVVAMHRFPVHGLLHNSYYGELFALTVALDKYYELTIHMDCQSIIDQVRLLQIDPDVWPNPSMQHCPFWKRIQRHICNRPRHCITLVKVTAHAAKPHESDVHAHWLYWGNMMVDQHAKDAVRVDARLAFNKVQRAYNKCQRNRKDLHILYDIAIAANKACAATYKTTVKKQNKNFQIDFNHDAFQSPTYTAKVALRLPRHLLLAFPWGPGFLWRVLYWASRLTWPKPGDSNNYGDISFLELLVDFVHTTGSWPPRNSSTQSQRNSDYGIGRYILDDEGSHADTVAQPLAAYSSVWKRAMVWIMQHSNIPVLHGDIIKRTQSLALCGCSAWHAGLSTRPTLAAGNSASLSLAGFFITKSGCIRTLDKVLHINTMKPLQYPRNLHVPFEERLSMILKAKDEFASYTV
eukprot:Skav235210  [mRNA]  locus=scaffold3680:21080:22903:+ [translate_table: standard]